MLLNQQPLEGAGSAAPRDVKALCLVQETAELIYNPSSQRTGPAQRKPSCPGIRQSGDKSRRDARGAASAEEDNWAGLGRGVSWQPAGNCFALPTGDASLVTDTVAENTRAL